MSVGANQPLMGVSQRADTQPVFKTWCSASVELAPSLVPQAVKVLPSVARSAQQEDRASILDRIIVSGAVVAALIGAGSLLIGIGYWFV